MKYSLLVLFLLLGSWTSFAESSCPMKLINLLLNCKGHNGDITIDGLQFLNHAGSYKLIEDTAKPGNNPDQKVISCTYAAEKWFSTYRLDGQTVQITNTQEIAADVAKKFNNVAFSRFKSTAKFSDAPMISMQYLVQDGTVPDDNSQMMFYISLGFDTLYNGDKPYFTSSPKQFSEPEMLASMQEQKPQTDALAPESIINTRVVRSDRFEDESDPSSTYPTGNNCQISIE